MKAFAFTQIRFDRRFDKRSVSVLIISWKFFESNVEIEYRLDYNNFFWISEVSKAFEVVDPIKSKYKFFSSTKA